MGGRTRHDAGATALLLATLLLAPAAAVAQDAGALADADLSAAATVGRGDAAAAPPATSSTGACQGDPIPAGHEVRIETLVRPAQPAVGERVLITYRLHHRPADRMEFDPDPVAFAQPGAELEYARQQPDRDRRQHAGTGGMVYGEVSVAVQPFKTGDVAIPAQLARLNAAGDVVRVCTPEVRFRVRDPFGNDPHPLPRDVTPPEVVTHDALSLRWVALALDGIFLVVLGTLAVSAYLARRPRPVAPPPPPRPAWIVAIEALDALGRSDLLARGLTKDYYDAISDIIRRYVGATLGFDALEMTTHEVITRVKRKGLPGVASAEVEHLLGECDLVKFARFVPSHEASEKILADAYAIVRRSSAAGAPTTPGGGSEGPEGPGGAEPGEARPVGPSTETRRA
jgi:hypothetical protein